jgi:hypothetical protein
MLAGLILYTLFGFFAAPRIIKHAQIDQARERYDRQITLERVTVNPFTLVVVLENNAMLDTDGTEIVAYDRFRMNLQLSSLFNWAWTFSKVSLEGVRIHEERFKNGESRLGRVLAAGRQNATSNRSNKRDPSRYESGLPRAIVHDLRVSNGQVYLVDHLDSETFEAEFHPINIKVANLSTLPDESGQQKVTIANETDAKIAWSGNLQLAPFQSAGRLTVEGRGLSEVHRYLDLMMPFSTSGEGVSVELDYRVDTDPDGSLSMDVSGLSAEIRGMKLELPDESAPILTLPMVTLEGGSFRWPEQEAAVASIVIDSPELNIWRNEDGSIGLKDLQPPQNGVDTEDGAPGIDTMGKEQTTQENEQTGLESDDTSEDSPSEAIGKGASGGFLEDWNFELSDFSILGATVGIEDRSMSDSPAVVLHDLTLGVRDLTNQPGASLPVQLSFQLESGGGVHFDGDLVVIPELDVKGRAKLEAVFLPVAQILRVMWCRPRLSQCLLADP